MLPYGQKTRVPISHNLNFSKNFIPFVKPKTKFSTLAKITGYPMLNNTFYFSTSFYFFSDKERDCYMVI